MKTFKLTLVILFIMAYAFILSGCSSKQFIYTRSIQDCTWSPGGYTIIKTHLDLTKLNNVECLTRELYTSLIDLDSINEIKELK